MATVYPGEAQFKGGVTESVAGTLTAAGTNLATALPLTSGLNVVTTAAASTGVSLPLTTSIGAPVTVQNLGANTIKAYPPNASSAINGTANGTGISVPAGSIGVFRKLTATTWLGFVVVGPTS